MASHLLRVCENRAAVTSQGEIPGLFFCFVLVLFIFYSKYKFTKTQTKSNRFFYFQ